MKIKVLCYTNSIKKDWLASLYCMVSFIIVCSFSVEFAFAQTNPVGGNTIYFIENKGQIADLDGNLRPDVVFTVKQKGMNLFFGKDRLSFVLRKTEDTRKNTGAGLLQDNIKGFLDSAKTTLQRIDVQFVNCNKDVKIEGLGLTDYFTNYYYPNCPNGITQVNSFNKIIYKNLYKNIDMVFYTHPKGGMEYDFIVHPGGNPFDIQLKYIGAEPELKKKSTFLNVQTINGHIQESFPMVYQRNGKTKSTISCKYKMKDNVVCFNIGRYDPTHTLIIDPWMTYLGGAGPYEGAINDLGTGVKICTDALNNVYITGIANSGFPTTVGTFQPANNGLTDVFLSKFNQTGAIIWATYIGGTKQEFGADIAIDNLKGAVNIVGSTDSNTDFPTGSSGANVVTQPTPLYPLKGSMFIAQFDNNLGTRNWTTYYAGDRALNSFSPAATGVATDNNGNLFVTGYADTDPSYPFPVTATACQATQKGGFDAFLLKFSANGSLLWATILTGSTYETGLAVTTDINGNAFVTGYSNSADFPYTTGPAIATGHDAFVAAYGNSNVNCTMLWARFIGGNGNDFGRGIAADATGNIFVCGETASTAGFPNTPPLTTTMAGGNVDAFITKLNGATGGITWSTYYGGSGDDVARGAAVNADNDVVVIGSTKSTNIPITAKAIQPNNAGGEDVFLTVRDGSSGDTICATYYGGSAQDKGSGIAVDGTGMLIVSGGTPSSNFPVSSGAYQSTRSGTSDAFVGQLCSVCGRQPTGVTLTCPTSGADSAIFMATGGGTYQWSTGGTNDTIHVKVASSGTYTYTVTVSLGSCSSTASYTKNFALPVTLALFTASTLENKLVLLQWQTATEINNDYFTIERSMDGINFESIGTVKGAGNSNTVKKYDFIDRYIPGNKNITLYYRLKQTDYNGKNTHSTIVSVLLNKEGLTVYPPYPNPASQTLTIKLDVSESALVSIDIVNVFGQVFLTKQQVLSQGSNALIMSVEMLPPGIYWIKTGIEHQHPLYQRWVKD